jgi:hypothetical protein
MITTRVRYEADLCEAATVEAVGLIEEMEALQLEAPHFVERVKQDRWILMGGYMVQTFNPLQDPLNDGLPAFWDQMLPATHMRITAVFAKREYYRGQAA